MMRLDIGQEEEERGLLVVVDVADSCIRQRVHAIAGQLDGFAIVVIHDSIVGIRGELQHIGGQPALVAAPVRLRHRPGDPPVRQMPLADIARIVARLPEEMCQRARILWQRDGVAITACRGGVHAGLQTGAGRPADGLAGDGRVQMCALTGHAVEIGCQVERVAMGRRLNPSAAGR